MFLYLRVRGAILDGQQPMSDVRSEVVSWRREREAWLIEVDERV